MDSSSSSSDKGDPFGVAAEGVETVFDAETVAAEVNSVDESTASGASSGEEGMVAGTSTEEDEVSMDELEVA